MATFVREIIAERKTWAGRASDLMLARAATREVALTEPQAGPEPTRSCRPTVIFSEIK